MKIERIEKKKRQKLVFGFRGWTKPKGKEGREQGQCPVVLLISHCLALSLRLGFGLGLPRTPD